MVKVTRKIVVKRLKELMEADEVKIAHKMSMSLSQPKSKIVDYLEKLGDVYNVETNTLEEWLSVLIEWENYFREKSEIYDALRTVAESQKSFYWGRAISMSMGQISEKKETARTNELFQQANNTYIQANVSCKMLNLKANNCERGYKLVSRILAKRINIREQ